MKFQTCVKDVTFEKGFKRKHEDVVVVQFNKTRSTPAFSYCPTYNELHQIILLLIQKYGAKKVFKELKIGVVIEE